MIVIPHRKTPEEIANDFWNVSFDNPQLKLEEIPEGFIVSNCSHLKDSYKVQDLTPFGPFTWIMMDVGCGEYGICDSPQQFANKFWAKLSRMSMPVAVFMNQLTLEQDGGRRWHKQGRYIGKRTNRGECFSDSPWFTNNLYEYRICYVNMHGIDKAIHSIER